MRVLLYVFFIIVGAWMAVWCFTSRNHTVHGIHAFGITAIGCVIFLVGLIYLIRFTFGHEKDL